MTNFTFMKVISTNISEIKTIIFNDQEIETGIFKYGISEGIFLGDEDVKNDSVVDRRYHGGIDKACYIYSTDHYKYWQKLYPNLTFEWGMFGENLSIENLDEKDIYIGDIYQLGEAVVQISQPREPCFKLGARFDTPKVVKQFLDANFPGIYLRIIKKGKVVSGDEMLLIESPEKKLTVIQYYRTICDRTPNEEWKQLMLNSEFVRESKKEEIIKKSSRHH